MAFAGDIQKMPLADVIQSIHQNELSGALAIRHRKIEHLMSFSEGYVTGCATPTGKDDDLGSEMIRRRLISSGDIGRPSRFFKRKGSLKRSLKRRRILDSGEFNSFARGVVLERIYQLFLLEEGTFEFLEDYDEARFSDDEQSAGVKIAPGEILMEAMRRVDEWKRIKRSIPSFKEVYIATREGDSDQDSALDREIISMTAAGNADLDTVLDNLPAARFTACEAILSLMERNALRVATAPEYLNLGKGAEEAQDFEAAANYFDRGLHYERGNTELNELHINVLERLDRKQEAAAERKLYAGLLLEQGNNKAAMEQYARAAELAASDPLPLERLLDLQVDQEKDYLSGRETAQKLVALYLRLGLGDSAKGVFPRLLLLKPKDRWLRSRMAETHVELHENGTAAQIYKELAQEHLDEADVKECAVYLRKALELTPDDEKTKTLLEEVESGTHAAKRRRRRIFIAAMIFLTVLSVSIAWGSYEAMALMDLRQASNESAAELDRGCDGILAAVNRLEDVAVAWPYTRAADWSNDLTINMAHLYAREARLSGSTLGVVDNPSDKPLDRDEFEKAWEEALKPKDKATLEDQVDYVEELIDDAHKEDDPEARARLEQKAVKILAEDLRPRLAAARAVVRRASVDLRQKKLFDDWLDRLRPFVPRIHLAWGRLHFKLPAALEILEKESAALKKRAKAWKKAEAAEEERDKKKNSRPKRK